MNRISELPAISIKCECEHEAHFPETEHPDRLTHAGHAYQAAPATHAIKTPYGTFARCDACATAKHMEPETAKRGDAWPLEVK